MVKDIWFDCSVCNEKIFDSKLVWVPICLTCAKNIENFYFHENCVYKVYEYLNDKIKAKCVDEYSIACEKCRVNENIGFDSME